MLYVFLLVWLQKGLVIRLGVLPLPSLPRSYPYSQAPRLSIYRRVFLISLLDYAADLLYAWNIKQKSYDQKSRVAYGNTYVHCVFSSLLGGARNMSMTSLKGDTAFQARSLVSQSVQISGFSRSM